MNVEGDKNRVVTLLGEICILLIVLSRLLDNRPCDPQKMTVAHVSAIIYLHTFIIINLL